MPNSESDVSANESVIQRNLILDEFKVLFAHLFERIFRVPPPRSIAESRLEQEFIERIERFFARLPFYFDPTTWLGNYIVGNIEEQTFSYREIFGGLLIAFTSERCRDRALEGMVWPLVHQAFSKPLRRTLFPGDQPSISCKQAIIAGAKRLELRNAIGFTGTQEYYDTIKLQCGFTFRGAKKRLPEWLVGLGTPFAVRMLLGESDNADLKSISFIQLWTSLQRYRRDHIPERQIREVLLNSPWIRPAWVEEIIKQAKARIEQLGRERYVSNETDLVEYDAHPDTIAEIKYAEEKNQPQLRIYIDIDAIDMLTRDIDTDRIRFFIDDEIISVWLRIKNGKWDGDEQGRNWLKCSSCSPSILRIESKNGDLLENIDMDQVGLHRDIVLFDKTTGRMVDAMHLLDTTRSYALICDNDLTFTQQIRRIPDKSSGRTIHLIHAPWLDDLKLMLGESIYWEPVLKNRPIQEPVHPVIRTGNPIRIGEDVQLIASNIPEETDNVEIVIDDNSYPTYRKKNEWFSEKKITMIPILLNGQKRIRIRVQRLNSNRIYQPRREFAVTGLVTYQRIDGQNEFQFRSFAQNEDLNLADNRYLFRVFHPPEQVTSLYEGSRLVCPLNKSGQIKSSDLYGWGDRLTLNARTAIVGSVVNQRNLFSFTPGIFRGETPPLIHLLSPIEPDNNHAVVVWNTERDKEPFIIYDYKQIESLQDDRIWNLNISGVGKTLGISFMGYCLGSNWDFREILQRLKKHPTAPTFAALRWLKFPVLSASWREEIKEAARTNPIDFLRAWWFDLGLTTSLLFPSKDPGRETVIRTFFQDWHATNHQRDQLIELFSPKEQESNRRDRYAKALIQAALLCPSIMWNIAQHIQTTNDGKKAIKKSWRNLLDLSNTNVITAQSVISEKKREYARVMGLEIDYVNQLFDYFIKNLTTNEELDPKCKMDIHRMVEMDVGRIYLAASTLLKLSHI